MKRRRQTRRGIRGAGVYVQRFRVAYEYPVHFTRDLFAPSNPVLADVLKQFPETPRRLLVYVDDGVARAWPKLPEAVRTWCDRNRSVVTLVREPEIVAGGERTKNGWNIVQGIMATIGSAHLCRHSFVMVIGGGSVLDMVGFAASLVHRGMRVIRVPTTVLAQCDAGVGVKTGMDEHGMKNFVGTFAPPAAVLIDSRFLHTLDDRYWFGGLSEAFKVAMIKDAAFFRRLCAGARRLRRRDEALMSSVVRRAARLHLDHIRTGGDPFEFGAARPLDFGHWSAHKLEVLSHYRLNHGQAVGVGIALDTCYAACRGLVSEADRDRLLASFRTLGLPAWDPALALPAEDGTPAILRGLEEFREHLGGELTITLPRGIGRKIEVHEMDTRLLADCIEYLGRYQEAAPA